MKANDPNITQEQLKKFLNYSPDTGVFTRAVWTGGNCPPVGSEAGWVHPLGYRWIKVLGITVVAHRLAWLYMTGEWPAEAVDHIDGDRENNRWNNLRAATHSQNRQNGRMHKNNTSGIKNSTQNFRVRVSSPNGHYSETFPTAQQAEDMARRMRAILHGEFARHQ